MATCDSPVGAVRLTTATKLYQIGELQSSTSVEQKAMVLIEGIENGRKANAFNVCHSRCSELSIKTKGSCRNACLS